MQINTSELYTATFKGYPDVLDVPQVCEILGICRDTAYALIRRGELIALRIGRSYRVPKVHLMKYIRCFDLTA